MTDSCSGSVPPARLGLVKFLKLHIHRALVSLCPATVAGMTFVGGQQPSCVPVIWHGRAGHGPCQKGGDLHPAARGIVIQAQRVPVVIPGKNAMNDNLSPSSSGGPGGLVKRTLAGWRSL